MSPKPPKQKKLKSTTAAYAWFWTLGLVGAHQYYLGNGGRGTLYLGTCAVLFGGWLWDLFTLSKQVQKANDSINLKNLAASSATIAQSVQQ